MSSLSATIDISKRFGSIVMLVRSDGWATGHHRPKVMLIYKGRGLRLQKIEVDTYRELKKDLVVAWAPKATWNENVAEIFANKMVRRRDQKCVVTCDGLSGHSYESFVQKMSFYGFDASCTCSYIHA